MDDYSIIRLQHIIERAPAHTLTEVAWSNTGQALIVATEIGLAWEIVFISYLLNAFCRI